MTSVTDYYNIIRFNKNENLQKLPNEIIRNIFEYVKHDFMIKVNKHYLKSSVLHFIKKQGMNHTDINIIDLITLLVKIVNMLEQYLSLIIAIYLIK